MMRAVHRQYIVLRAYESFKSLFTSIYIQGGVHFSESTPINITAIKTDTPTAIRTHFIVVI
jgi:hypothetical protein